MRFDRKKSTERFKKYVLNYNMDDLKINLKFTHTFRVCANCEEIAKGLNLSDVDIDFAWLLGLLHDVGRFEQIRRFGTFNDAVSIDHAHLGADLLFSEGLIWEFIAPIEEQPATIMEELLLLERAIRLHNIYRLPYNLTAREKFFCDLIRDADKLDIFRVNVEVPLTEIYQVSEEELFQTEVSEAVMESMRECHATLRNLKSTAADHIVGHISLAYELIYPVSIQILKKQGYFAKLLSFQSRNSKTNQDFAEIRDCMKRYFLRTEQRESRREQLDQQFDFAREIDKEKLICRQTYLSDASRKENDAEHAWHLAMMTILLSDYANVPIDVLHTVTMVLLHDIVEIDAGDTYAFDEENKKTQRNREVQASKRLFGILPREQGEKLRLIWEEFEEQKTPEAKFARTMDNLQPAMLNDASGGLSWREHQVQLSQILNRNKNTANGSKELWEYAFENIFSPNVKNGNIS